MNKKNIIISVISLFSFLGLGNNQFLSSKINENSWNEGKQRQLEFLNLIEHNKELSDYDKLVLINNYINEHINFSSDISLWDNIDYWASPLETLNQGAGDCEDFAIIKYFALKKLGMNFNKLRFFYVKYYDGELSLPLSNT